MQSKNNIKIFSILLLSIVFVGCDTKEVMKTILKDTLLSNESVKKVLDISEDTSEKEIAGKIIDKVTYFSSLETQYNSVLTDNEKLKQENESLKEKLEKKANNIKSMF